MFVQIGDKSMQRSTRLSIYQTKLFRKFICENANRFIFSNFQDREVVKLKPGTVNDEQYKLEKNDIEKWHERNKSFELEFFK